MSTFELRQRLVDLARRDVGKTEQSKNHAPWIEKLWSSTSYGPDGYANREPYCAAGVTYNVKQWLQDEVVRQAFGFKTEQEAEAWRCKSASAYRDDHSWLNWAKQAKGVQILPRFCILHAGDLVVYTFSHIELVTNDDNTVSGPFVAIGYNTNAAGSRDGEGCFEKPRSRDNVLAFIRLLP